MSTGLKIGRMVIGSYGTNCYFLYQEESKKCIVIDPADDGKHIYEALYNKGFAIKAILLTHGHFDHIWGAEALKNSSGAEIYALEDEKELLGNVKMNVSEWAGRACSLIPDHTFKDGETITIDDFKFKVISTPGHTSGSCCYYFYEADLIVCGDTIFYESIGRTDFPTGSASQLIHSIKDKLFILNDDITLYPGHGDSTSIGHEKEYNPCV